MVIGGYQTWCITNSTVDVVHHAAAAANEMMMVVANPIFITRNRTCWLNTPYKPLLHEHVQRVIDRLARNRTKPSVDCFDEFIGGGVRVSRDSFGDRYALRGHVYPAIAQTLADVVLMSPTHKRNSIT